LDQLGTSVNSNATSTVEVSPTVQQISKTVIAPLPFKAYYSHFAMRPPDVPAAGKLTSEPVHLGPKDSKFVENFIQIMDQGLSRQIRYEKVILAFDILCYDFGPHVFIQREDLLDVTHLSRYSR
jgi:hypothetical protein